MRIGLFSYQIGGPSFLYLLSGRDEFLRDEYVGKLKTLMRRLTAGEHNITEMDGSTAIGTLIAACNTTPFLCDKRMVIAQGIAAHNRRGSALSELTDYLPSLPATTHLVLIEDDDTGLDDLAAARNDTVRQRFPRRRPDEIPQWVSQRTRHYGARMAADAARALTEMAGDDLRQLDREISKLATYTEAGSVITIEAVRTLVHGDSPNIFAWHDAIAEGRSGAALAATRGLLESGSDPAELLPQVVALVRRLMVVRELTDEGRSIAREGPAFGLSSSSFAQDKLRKQAGRLSPALIEQWYKTLYETDVLTKTGRLDAELALELAIAQIAGIEPAATPPAGDFADALSIG